LVNHQKALNPSGFREPAGSLLAPIINEMFEQELSTMIDRRFADLTDAVAPSRKITDRNR